MIVNQVRDDIPPRQVMSKETSSLHFDSILLSPQYQISLTNVLLCVLTD